MPPLRRLPSSSAHPPARAAGSSVAVLLRHHRSYTELYNVGHVDYYAPRSHDDPVLVEHDYDHRGQQQRGASSDGQHDNVDAAASEALAAQGRTGHVSKGRVRVSQVGSSRPGNFRDGDFGEV